jgi:hypothetical protein
MSIPIRNVDVAANPYGGFTMKKLMFVFTLVFAVAIQMGPALAFDMGQVDSAEQLCDGCGCKAAKADAKCTCGEECKCGKGCKDGVECKCGKDCKCKQGGECACGAECKCGKGCKDGAECTCGKDCKCKKGEEGCKGKGECGCGKK